MSLPIPITQYIEYGNICSFLSATDFSRQKLFKGSSFNTKLPEKLSMITRLVEWNYNRDPNDETLIDTGIYLFQLCGAYLQKAKQLIGNMGLIINPANDAVSTLVPVYLQFKVGTTSSPVSVNGVNVTLPTDGQNQIVLPLTFLLASLAVIKDGVQLPFNLSDRLSVNIAYTDNDATITLSPVGAVFNNGDVYVIAGFQFVAV
jgi:hypothetical protein